MLNVPVRAKRLNMEVRGQRFTIGTYMCHSSMTPDCE